MLTNRWNLPYFLNQVCLHGSKLIILFFSEVLGLGLWSPSEGVTFCICQAQDSSFCNIPDLSLS